MSKRVVVAMSGGVDSSVAAGLLVRQGYEVIGITLQLWPADLPPDHEGGCCSLGAVEDARRVAARLGFPHYVINMRDSFQEFVIRNFIDEYAAGRTPNPCVRCNQFIKFDAFLSRALDLDADFIATGHYARVGFDEARRQWVLSRARDSAKDQTYALYTLTQEQLSCSLFPLGDRVKEETRALAAEMGLAVAGKPDSQDICFIPKGDYGAFLQRKAPDTAQPGSIVDTQGQELGRHSGVAFYTVGQRKGLGLGGPEPRYVTEVRPDQRLVVVGSADDLLGRGLRTARFHGALPVGQEVAAVCAKVRYRMPEAPADLRLMPDGGAELWFHEAQRAITPGQSFVCYQEDRMVGGGVIDGVLG